MKHPYYLFPIVSCLIIACATDQHEPIEHREITISTSILKQIDLNGFDLSFSYNYQPSGSDNLYFTNSDIEKELIISCLNLNTFELKELLKVPIDFYVEAYTVDEKKAHILVFSEDSLYTY